MHSLYYNSYNIETFARTVPGFTFFQKELQFILDCERISFPPVAPEMNRSREGELALLKGMEFKIHPLMAVAYPGSQAAMFKWRETELAGLKGVSRRCERLLRAVAHAKRTMDALPQIIACRISELRNNEIGKLKVMGQSKG